MIRAKRNRSSLICLLAILILAGWLRTPGLATGRTFTDEGFRIAVAQPISRGYTPYRDVVGLGPPGAILFNAAILRMSNDSIVAVRISYLAISLLTLCAVFGIAYSISGLLAANIAGLLVATNPWDVYYAYHVMTEPMMLLLALLSVLSIIRNSGRISPGKFFLAGILGALSVMVKQPGAVVLVGIALVQLIDGIRLKTYRVAAANILALTAGTATAMGAWSAWALAHDIWDPWFKEMTSYSALNSAQLHRLMDVPNNGEMEKWISLFRSYLTRRIFFPFGILAVAVIPFIRKEDEDLSKAIVSPSHPHLMLVALLAAGYSLFTFLLPLNYHGGLSHYLLMTEPWWILLASCFVARALHRAWETFRSKEHKALALLLFLALIAVAERVGPEHYQDLLKWRGVNEEPPRSLRWERILSSRLASATAPVVMTNPIYYFHLGKYPPGYPLNYGLIFDITTLSAIDSGKADELIATAISASDVLLVDPRRRSIVLDSLKRSQVPFRLEPLFSAGTYSIYSIDPKRDGPHVEEAPH